MPYVPQDAQYNPRQCQGSFSSSGVKTETE